MAKTPKISVLTIGVDDSTSMNLLKPLLSFTNIHYSLVCSNLLDFELPPKIENGVKLFYRHELKSVLNIIAPETYTISESLKNLLEENDRLELSESELAIVNHINQIEQNSTNLEQSYELLQKETDNEHISLYPLIIEDLSLLAFKNKKYAPVRYYLEREELLKEAPPPREDKTKRKYDDKKLIIENIDSLKTLKLNETARKAFQQSDLIVIFPHDIISFNFLLKSTELEKLIKKMDTPIVLVWQFKADRESTKVESEINYAMEFTQTFENLAEEIANLTDYIIIDKSDKDYVDEFREAGCHVLVNDLGNGFNENPQDLIQTIFNIGGIKIDMDSAIAVHEESSGENGDKIETSQDDIVENGEKKPMSINKLVESPEEAGNEKIKNGDNGKQVETEVSSKNGNNNPKVKTVENKPDNGDIKSEKPQLVKPEIVEVEESKSNEFKSVEDEEWIDTVNRAIEVSFEKSEDSAINWLIDQSKKDNDNEVQIAGEIIKVWGNSRSNLERRKGAKIISKLAEHSKDTYIQVSLKPLLTAVNEGDEDRRRRFVQLFNILNEVDPEFSELLIKEITKQLALPNEVPAILERSKITIVQLVINSKRLSKVSINELIIILDKDSAPPSQIWNILTTFDAGNVAIELVTNFSITKAEEIIRRANFLRFTGSVFKILQNVLNAWQTGDRDAIADATGAILPELTLRKFERIELARTVVKLKMVKLTTLADSLGKDVETVERLITELIVNDELDAEMKLIDEKMYLVASEDAQDEN